MANSPSTFYGASVPEADATADAVLYHSDPLHGMNRRVSCFVVRDADRPGVFTLCDQHMRLYSTGVLAPLQIGTSVLLPIAVDAFVLPTSGIPADVWLPELDWRLGPMGEPPQTAVSVQLREIQRVTSLSDTQLAATFPGGVSRETVVRWRTRPQPNLRPENAYRLGLLYELASRIDQAGIDARLWFHQAVEGREETPYQLICAGRLGEVRHAIEVVATGHRSPVEPMSASELYRERDIDEGVDEGEDEWVWSSNDGDNA